MDLYNSTLQLKGCDYNSGWGRGEAGGQVQGLKWREKWEKPVEKCDRVRSLVSWKLVNCLIKGLLKYCRAELSIFSPQSSIYGRMECKIMCNSRCLGCTYFPIQEIRPNIY